VPTSHPEPRPWIVEQVALLRPETILDVGPGNGTYARLLCAVDRIEAVEAWAPYVSQYRLDELYDEVHVADIRQWRWPDRRWSLVVLGDVLEHMSRADAADVYTAAQQHADAVLVVIPIVDSPQGAHEGNPFEVHVVEDWRHEQAMDAFRPTTFWTGERKGAYLWC
jgi:hypothetical protein